MTTALFPLHCAFVSTTSRSGPYGTYRLILGANSDLPWPLSRRFTGAEAVSSTSCVTERFNPAKREGLSAVLEILFFRGVRN
uniref:Uncharacterized protein n=1 Tax=Rhipicephalus zambeziensis TaxID=60191 RepID=A0A224YAS8_9ACAR